MKKIGSFVLVIIVTTSAQAQTWQEWFKQKETQIQYLVDQIDALQVYANSLEKGYEIAQTGLTAIRNIKDGDFSLHSQYISSLSKVNPQIQSYWKVAAIIQTEISIIRACASQNNLVKSSRFFTEDEMRYCSSVVNALLHGCTEIVDQLTITTCDGKLQMKDDERLAKIDQLFAAMKDRDKFVQSFSSEIKMLALQRARDHNEVEGLRSLIDVR